MADVMSDAEYGNWLSEPETFGDEFFREGASALFEGITEDNVPKGTSPALFLTAFFYAIGKKGTSFPLLAALDTDPVTIAKITLRGSFAGLEALATSSRLPRGLLFLLRKAGPIGGGATGSLKGLLDAVRRDVVNRLNALKTMPDMAAREASLQPALGVAEGLIEFRWNRLVNRAGSAKAPKAADISSGALPGTGKARYIRDYLSVLELTATTKSAQERVLLQSTNLELFKTSFPEEAADVFELSARGLMPPEEIANILALPDGDFVRSDKKDAAGKWITIPLRESRLKALAREARKRVNEARLADGTDKPATPTLDLGPSPDLKVAWKRRQALAQATSGGSAWERFTEPFQHVPLPLVGNPRFWIALAVVFLVGLSVIIGRRFVGEHPTGAPVRSISRVRVVRPAHVDGGAIRAFNDVYSNNLQQDASTGNWFSADAGE